MRNDEAEGRGVRPFVAAVVPTYRPDLAVVDRIQRLRGMVGLVVVVDDGSGDAARVLDVFDGDGDDILLVKEARNAGIAAALNRGIERALDRGADYLLTVDQDTVLPADYVATSLAVFERARPVTNLGLVVVDAINGIPSEPYLRSPEGLALTTEALQTGFVLSAECFRACGPFDERLVIDGVDTEYCLRIRRGGYLIAIAEGTDIEHAIGRQVPLRRPFKPVVDEHGRVVTFQYHPPFRRYYITRNGIDLSRRFVDFDPDWARAVREREFQGARRSVMSGPHRVAHALAIAAGYVDGRRGRRGKIPRWLEMVIA